MGQCVQGLRLRRARRAELRRAEVTLATASVFDTLAQMDEKSSLACVGSIIRARTFAYSLYYRLFAAGNKCGIDALL